MGPPGTAGTSGAWPNAPRTCCSWPALGGPAAGSCSPSAVDPHGGAEARIDSGRHHAAATAPGALVASVGGFRGGILIPPRFYSPRWSGSPDSFRASPCSCYRTWRSRRQRWGVPRGDPDPPALLFPTVERKPGFIPGVTMQLLPHLALSSPALGGSAGGS